jgi:hypothetical protein
MPINVIAVFMVFALISALLLSTACLIGEGFGLGKHIWNLSADLLDLPYDVGRVTKALYGCYLAYSTSITFTKFSIMATYIRIFPNGLLRYLIYGVGVVVAVFWVTSVFAIIFTCVPVQAAWDYSITTAKCIHILDYFYISAGVNIATDLLLCFLPLPTIWSLQMPKAQRVVVCLIFGMGTLYVLHTSSNPLPPQFPSPQTNKAQCLRSKHATANSTPPPERHRRPLFVSPPPNPLENPF